MLIGIGFIIVGCILIIITKKAVKQGRMQEQDKKAKILKVIGNILIGVAFPIWMYLITDTLREWLITTLLLFAAVGVSGVVSSVSNRLQVPRWSLPTILVPLAGMVCWGLSYSIISFTISTTSKSLVIGIMASLFGTVNQITKENKKYKTLMLAEVMALYLVTLTISYDSLPQTKPIRLIHEKLDELSENSEYIKIREDIDSPKRGERALFRVFIERENGLLEEIRYYNYIEGHVSLESIEKFKQ